MNPPKAETIKKLNLSMGLINRIRTDLVQLGSYLFILLISLFLTVTPFYRGLYFRENYIPSIISISAIFIFYFLYKLSAGSKKLGITAIDIIVALIPVAYAISFLTSVNVREAFDAILKYFSYFMVYYIAKDLSSEKKNMRLIIEGIAFSIFITAFVCIIGAAGYIKLSGAFLDKVIYGPYQYTNTTASVLGVGMLLYLGLLLRSRKAAEAAYYQFCLTTLLSVFIMTISRGAYLIFGVMLLLYFIVSNFRDKILIIVNMLITLIPSAVIIYTYYKYNSRTFVFACIAAIFLSVILQLGSLRLLAKRDYASVPFNKQVIFYALLAVICIVLMVVLLIKVPLDLTLESGTSKYKVLYNLKPGTEYTIKYDIKADSSNTPNYAITITGQNEKYEYKQLGYDSALITAGKLTGRELKFKTLSDTDAVYVYFYNPIQEKGHYVTYQNATIYDDSGNMVEKIKQFMFLPTQIADRLETINLKSNYNDARFVYALDGLKIFKDYFLTGTGGGGWASLYNRYQSYPYSTKETHNFYVQYIIEVGILGGVLILALIYYILKGFYTNVLKDKDSLLMPVYFSLFMLMLHASLDIDLSLCAPAFIMWCILGVTASKHKDIVLSKSVKPYALVALCLAAIFVLYNSTSVYAGMKYGNKAALMVNSIQKKGTGNIQDAEPLYKKAIKLDKYNCAYRMDYVQVLNSKLKINKSSATKAELDRNIELIQKYEPNNLAYNNVLIGVMLRNGELKKAVELVNSTVESQPLNISVYSMKIDVNYKIAEVLFREKHRKEAIPYLNNMISVGDQLKQAQARSTKVIEVPKKIYDMIGLANNWMKNASRADGN